MQKSSEEYGLMIEESSLWSKCKQRHDACAIAMLIKTDHIISLHAS